MCWFQTNYRTNTGEGKGICILTFSTSRPVLLLPLTCFGEMDPPLARGLDGRPIPTNALRGGAGTGRAGTLPSSGVGGSSFMTSICGDCLVDSNFASPLCSRDVLSSELSESLIVAVVGLGIETGGIGPPLPARGPAPNSARLLNFRTAGMGSAFLFTIVARSAEGTSTRAGLVSPCDNRESLRAKSVCDLGVLATTAERCALLRSDLIGGGGGGEGRLLFSNFDGAGDFCK